MGLERFTEWMRNLPERIFHPEPKPESSTESFEERLINLRARSRRSREDLEGLKEQFPKQN